LLATTLQQNYINLYCRTLKIKLTEN
jgi:hypothetical protein